MVEIIDTSDTDWWRVRCPITGSVGYMPSAYLAQLHLGERAQQVTQLCSINVIGGQPINLMKDQVSKTFKYVGPLFIPPDCDKNVCRETGKTENW